MNRPSRYGARPFPAFLVTLTQNYSRRRFNWWDRVGLALVGLALAGLLLLARALDPAPRGYGTHEQLGLPPCTILTVTGRRCPSCGMTTSFAHLVRGQVLEAIETNAAGALFGVVVMALVPWCWVSAWVGQPVGVRSVKPALTVLAAVLITVSLGSWSLRLLF